MVTSSRGAAITAKQVGDASTIPLRKAVVGSAIFGAVASLAMAMYAMLASATYQHHGFFTPLYHIASTFFAPNALTASMQHAMTGSAFYFDLGPALLGAVVHMMTGAMYGAVFGLAVSLLRLRGAVLVGAGGLWGAAVFAISAWAGLPIAASLFGSGDQITHMATMVGYGTFLVEHVLFGLALGLLLVAPATARR